MQDIEYFLRTQTGYRRVVLEIISFCKEPQFIDNIITFVNNMPGATKLALSAIEIVSLMKDYKVIDLIYGSSNKSESYKITELGEDTLHKHNVDSELSKLFKENVKLEQIFISLLNFCKGDKKLSEIESEFASNSILKEEKVFVNYCVGELERAGGIFWNGDVWKTSDSAVSFIESN